MTPDEAGDTLAPLVVACTDWTDAKFDMWRHMIADECTDPDAARQASVQVVRTLPNTFVPPYSAWLDAYKAIRTRRIQANAPRALPAPRADRPSLRAAIDAAKAVIGNGRHNEHTPGHIGCQRCDDIAKAFMAEMPANLPGALYRCPRCHDTGSMEIDSTGRGTVDYCDHPSHTYRRPT